RRSVWFDRSPKRWVDERRFAISCLSRGLSPSPHVRGWQRMWRREIRYTRIKLCEFESLDSACEASTLGVDALGFHVFRHQAVDEKTRKFGEFFSQLPGEVERVLL